MGTCEQELPALDSFSGLVLTITALSGELPASLVDRFPASDAYKEYAVKQLKRDNLLRTFNRNGVRGLRLTAAAKRLMLDSWPAQFSPYLSGNTETNHLKSEVPRRLRLHRMAEVLVTMLNADVSVLPWEKPAVFSPAPSDEPLSIDRPTYYSSKEVKELGEQAIKIRGSRATGVLLTDGDIFVVYNTGPGQMKWEYKAEMRVKALLQMELCQTRLSAQFLRAQQSAIVFAADMDQMAPLMGVGEDKRHNYFILDGNFEHFYYLTSDHRGEVILRLLCDMELRAMLDAILSQDLLLPDAGLSIENDALDGDVPVLFGYTCDVPRLRRFDTALSLHERDGLVICFDFQEDTFRQVCGPRANFQSIDFQRVSELFT